MPRALTLWYRCFNKASLRVIVKTANRIREGDGNAVHINSPCIKHGRPVRKNSTAAHTRPPPFVPQVAYALLQKSALQPKTLSRVKGCTSTIKYKMSSGLCSKQQAFRLNLKLTNAIIAVHSEPSLFRAKSAFSWNGMAKRAWGLLKSGEAAGGIGCPQTCSNPQRQYSEGPSKILAKIFKSICKCRSNT